MLDQLTALVSTLLALSLAVERVVEILKGLIRVWPFTPQEDGDKEDRRSAAIHILSAIIGSVIAALGHIAIIGSWNASSPLDNTTNVVLAGLLSCGGSAFWNHVLDILKAMKVNREAQARLTLGATRAITASQKLYIA
jgi:hypothetical protein